MSGPVKKLAGEAAKKGGLLNTLLKVAPWKITGPASGPEWQEVPVGAEDYRVVAPASQPATVKVPWSESDRVYDVRYHSRDSRRKFEPVLHGATGSTTEIDAQTLFAETAKNAPSVAAFTPGARHGSQDPGALGSEYRRAPHLEQTNGGYTSGECNKLRAARYLRLCRLPTTNESY